MTVQRVYIDTSVLGGCFDPEFALWSNGMIKDFRLGNFIPVFSKVVALEVVNAPDKVKDIYEELLAFDKIRLFNKINAKQGYKPLSIYSPREVSNYGEESF